MTSKEIVKDHLYNNENDLIRVLENLECHHINPNYGNGEIRCALPDGTTPNSVSVRRTPFLPCHIYSRSGFDSYNIKDIFALVQFIRCCNFSDALSWLCDQIGIENDGIISCPGQLAIVKDIRHEQQRIKINTLEPIEHIYLDKNILKKYKPIVVQDWIKEGISPEIQKKYGILNDVYNKRWLIPIYDENGNLVSLKGRTYAPNWDIIGIQKYLYYSKIGVADILFGFNINKDLIAEKNEIILFESEKSVMAADTYGYGWSSSLGTNTVTVPLFKKILKVPCANTVIALDKDVTWKAALEEAHKLTKYKNVWIIFDDKGVLSGKESPTDKGKEIFEELYKQRIRVK